MKTFNTWTAHPWGITEDKTKTPIARVSPLLDATESESLGRLIAAAPELLDALQSCVSELNQLAFLSGDKLAGPAIQKGLDAIAKAEGRTE